ncbi:MAG: hypothetical protein V1800_18070 [Candidatus Latescibacterota bacterium]
MLYLFLNVVFVSFYALLYKASSRRGCRPLSVNLLLSFSATVMIAAYMALTRTVAFHPTAALLGGIQGVFGWVAVLAFFQVALHGELSVSWTIMNLCLILPIGASLVFWKEIPNLYQVAGIVLIIPSLILFGNMGHRQGSISRKWLKFLIISFLASGVSQILSKAVHEMGVDRYKAVFMLFSYGVSFLLTAGLIGARGTFPTGKEVVMGSLMGLLSLLTASCALIALESLRGIVVFPVGGAGNLVLTAALSFLVFRERLDRRKVSAILLAVAAIVLISIRTQ